MALTGLKLRCALSQTVSTEITVPVTAGYTSGDLVLVDSIPVIVANTASFGESVAVFTEAEAVLVPCAAASTGAYAQGALVYLDDADDEVNESSTGNTKCGYVLEQPATGATEVLVRWNANLAL